MRLPSLPLPVRERARLLPLALFALFVAWAPGAPAAKPRWLGEAPATPARVVTLAPSLTQIAIDLGRKELLVGVSRYDEAPEVEALPRVGGYLDPSPEAILALRPDLLLAQPSPGNQGAVERLAKLGIPVLVLPLHTVGETLASVRAVGAGLGVPDAGEKLAARIAAGIETTSRRLAGRERRHVLLVYGWQPLVVAGPASFAHELLVAAGGRNVAEDAAGAYPTLSAEALLASAPEVVIDATGGHGAGGRVPGLEGKVHALRSKGLFHPGPRMLEALEELAALLHPDAVPPRQADGREQAEADGSQGDEDAATAAQGEAP